MWSVTGKHPLWTWWPPLYPSWCKLAAGALGWGLEALAPDEVNDMLDFSPHIYTSPRFGGPGAVRAPPPKPDAGCRTPGARTELRPPSMSAQRTGPSGLICGNVEESHTFSVIIGAVRPPGRQIGTPHLLGGL